MPVGERRLVVDRVERREWPDTARALHQLRLLRGVRASADTFRAAAAAAAGGMAGGDADLLAEPCPLLAEQLAEFGFPHGSLSDREDDDGASEGSQVFLAPQASSFLQVGQVLGGKQKVTHVVTQKKEHWGVVVRIQGLDLASGYVCGTMEACNVPDSQSPVITFWEGEIIDNRNHSFMTWKWEATRDVDMLHWSKFEAFKPLRVQVERSAGRCSKLAEHPYIFMRWKEQFFVNMPADCRLTIAGFYYICLNRQTGHIEGLYYDRSSSPYQRLDLRPVQCGRVLDAQQQGQQTGHNFTSYQLR